MAMAITATKSRHLKTSAPEFSVLKVQDSDAFRIHSEMTIRVGISAYWRKNTSSMEAAELANLLRALRKVAGHLGENAGRIEYTGMSAACEDDILIDPEMVMGTYPVPVEQVDLLVGIIVHEALHRIEWSDHVWKLLEPAMAKLPPLQRVIFQKIVRTGEDIYIDLKSDQGVFGLYAKIAREKFISKELNRLAKAGPSVDDLVLRWQIHAFDGMKNRQQPSAYDMLLNDFAMVTADLRSLLGATSSGVLKRCEHRADLFLSVWKKMEKAICSLKIIDKQLCWFRSTKGDSLPPEKTSGTACKKSGTMPPLLAREVETHLAADSVDMTPIIRSVVGFDDETVVPMSRWDFNIPSHPVIDRKMVGRLRAIFSHYADRNFLVSRGLATGRIDRRRLYRAHLNGRCFQAIDRIPKLDWNVALLIDASGSMRGNKWQMVENTVANIHKAFTGYQNRLSAWAYFEVNSISMISRLVQKNRLFSVPPSGQTASGQAIIAAATMMPADVNRKIMIHITDGESNYGCDVSFGKQYCRQKNIYLITLGCGYKNKPAMQQQYGRTLQFIDYFEQLPNAMESLFKWAFLYGARGSCQIPEIRLG